MLKLVLKKKDIEEKKAVPFAYPREKCVYTIESWITHIENSLSKLNLKKKKKKTFFVYPKKKKKKCSIKSWITDVWNTLENNYHKKKDIQ